MALSEAAARAGAELVRRDATRRCARRLERVADAAAPGDRRTAADPAAGRDDAGRRADPPRSQPRARAVILHGRDHGDRRPDLAGSLGGGGRYDNLIGMFLGRDIPACGFSLGLERIIVVMTERTCFPADGHARRGRCDGHVLDDETAGDALALASELRARGPARRCLSRRRGKFGKPLKYASARGAPFMAILGEDERARGEVASEPARRGEQTASPRRRGVRDCRHSRELRTGRSTVDDCNLELRTLNSEWLNSSAI